jgi:hypothetical protein
VPIFKAVESSVWETRESRLFEDCFGDAIDAEKELNDLLGAIGANEAAIVNKETTTVRFMLK